MDTVQYYKNYLTAKFQNPSKDRWLVYDWDNHGADYGFMITHISDTTTFLFISYQDSGYSKGHILLEMDVSNKEDAKKLFVMIECFQANTSYE